MKPISAAPPAGSWAGEEFRKRHTEVKDWQGRPVGWEEKPQGPLPEWWGKPSILIPGIEHATVLGPIDPKWARVFNG